MRNAGPELRRPQIRFSNGRGSVSALIPLAFLTLSPLYGATPVRFGGAVSGLVTNSGGAPQPGATVSLFNQQAKLLQKSYTDLAGNFSFGDLLPDLYSVQVSLATFVPASRERVPVRPGMRSLLEVSLSKVFSSIQVVSTVPAPGGLMSDDWKWTLRTDSSLRPVLRLLPTAPLPATSATTKTAAFHNSSGMVKISASDNSLTNAASDQADLGTQFAFATSLYSRSQVRVSGDLGYASTGMPAAAIRTTFRQQIAGATPSVSVTMRQMNVPSRVGQGMLGNPGDSPLPTLRTISFSMSDRAQLSDALSLSYGSELDTVSFLNRLQYFSPWAKLTYETGHGHLDMVFTSGNAQPGLDSRDRNDDLRNELAALSLLPRLSESGGAIKVQRGDDYEIGYTQTIGSMEYRVSAYHQYISNAGLMIANADSTLFAGDLLPSMFNSSATFDAGNISDFGYTLSATRSLGIHHKLTVSYGTLGVMTPDQEKSSIADAASLRRAISASDRQAIALRSSGTFKHTGTRYVASYQFADLKSSVAMASFSTQPDRTEPGLNIAFRQPIPFFPGSVGRMEATAEMRNLLAQGYLPLAMTNGTQLLVVNNPRVFRGGLAFIF